MHSDRTLCHPDQKVLEAKASHHHLFSEQTTFSYIQTPTTHLPIIQKKYNPPPQTFTMGRPDGPRDPIAGPDAPQPPFPLKLRGPVIKGFGRGSKEVTHLSHHA